MANLLVHHIAVTVTELDRAERFYGEVIGLSVQRRWTDERGAPRSIWFDLDAGAFLAVELASGPRQSGAGWHCIAFMIAKADRETWRQRLERAGHPIERETAYTIYTRDPDGNLLGFSHFPS